MNQNATSYNQRNVVITATLTPDTVAVPEPSTLSLAFAAAMGTLAGFPLAPEAVGRRLRLDG